MSNNLIFSGIQPTGNLHLGNYLGAIRNWVKLQNDFDCIFCVVDLHAITIPQDPKVLHASIREVAAGLIASGVDPKKNILFNQSRVPAHAELAWVLNCIARMGWLNRMTQFKDKAGKNRDNATVGLYVYPNLMAADILTYKATHVPVGDDQKQHLELARDIAQAFNSQYGVEFFPLPEPQIFGAATRVMSLRDGTKKMSKSDASDQSRINLTDGPDEIGPVGSRCRRCGDGIRRQGLRRVQDPAGRPRRVGAGADRAGDAAPDRRPRLCRFRAARGRGEGQRHCRPDRRSGARYRRLSAVEFLGFAVFAPQSGAIRLPAMMRVRLIRQGIRTI